MTTVLVVGATEQERDRLAAPDHEYELRTAPAEELRGRPGSRIAGEPDAVVLGAGLPDPVPLVQAVHRSHPLAAVVVLAHPDDEALRRRSLSYAPGVPASLVVLRATDPALAPQVAQLALAAARRRRHNELVSTVAARTTSRAQVLVGTSLGALLDHAPFGVLVGTAEGALVSWNHRAEEMLRLRPGRLGEPIPRLFSDPEPFEELFARARTGLVTETLPAEPLDDPSGLLVEVTAVPTRLDDGRGAVLLLIQDVTPRRRAEQRRDRLAAQVQLLGRVTESLTGTLDPHEALRRLADAVVPTLCDLVSVQLYDERGRTVRVAMRHRHPAMEQLARAAAELLPEATSEGSPSRRIAAGEEYVLIPEFDDAFLAQMVENAEVLAMLRRMDIRSVLSVPLPARDRVLGSVVLVNTSSSPRFAKEDVAVALEVGRRAGLALQTAELFARQRDLAEELQRSMLTEPPEPDHGEIVVRYVTAAREAQVGGDWYDAFLQRDGATVVAIGDVVGHDTRAAAAMGQVRGLLRGIGFTTGAGPAEILRRLDEAIEGLMVNTTASAVVARIEQEERWSRDGIARVRWSNAGHPPPVVVPRGGSAALLRAPEPDLLLGVMADTERHEAEVLLGRDATLLFYTDGLVERRDQSVEDGMAVLLRTVDRLVHLPLAELCDRLLEEMQPHEAEDDVALVAVRLHRQDRRRPREAGPNRIPPNVPPPPTAQ